MAFTMPGFVGSLLIDLPVPLPHFLRPNRAAGDNPFLSGKDFFDDVTVHIREAEVPTRVTVGEFFVIEPQKMENGRVQIVDVNDIFHGLKTELVGCPMNMPSFDPAP